MITITRVEHLIQGKKEDCSYCYLLEQVLNTDPEPVAFVDDKGEIVFLNQAYLDFLKIKEKDAIGKHVTKIINNTRLHIICSEQKAEIGYLQNIKGKEAIVHRIPLVIDGETVGAIGKVTFRNIEEIKSLVKRLSLLENKLEKYEKETLEDMTADYTLDDIDGSSNTMENVKKMAYKIAATNSAVLIQGETGVGKELFAQGIHNASARRMGAFISVNCAAIPHDLLESELFGYEEGAFSGAKKKGKTGKFTLADGGTLFLDEIGDMPLRMQAKLLRVLQDKHVEKIGGLSKQKIDTRIIAATNQNIELKTQKGEFRKDLYYRLNTISLVIPPLRERLKDIEPIVSKNLKQLNSDQDTNKTITPEAMNLLLKHDWPGNVRELVNLIERLVFMVDDDILKPYHIKNFLFDQYPIDDGEYEYENEQVPLSDSIDVKEMELIEKALELFDGNKTRAAEFLGIHRTTLHHKLRKYNSSEKHHY